MSGQVIMLEFWDGKCVFCMRVAGVLRRSGYILLQHAPGGFILPGGRVEFLEHTRSALSREIWEELGVHIEVGRLLWIVENVFDHQGIHVHQMLNIYEMETGQEISGEKMQAERMHWWPIDEIESMRMFPEFLRTSIGALPATVEHVCIE